MLSQPTRARYTVLEFKNKRLLLHYTGNRVTVMTQVQMPWASFFILSSIIIQIVTVIKITKLGASQ